MKSGNGPEAGGRALKVGDWTIDDLLVRARVEGRGPLHECDGLCCSHGVYVSLDERDRILARRDRVRAVMDDTQVAEVDAWFEDELVEDSDFPGGVCVGTEVVNDKCAFLNADGLCTLQIAEADLPDGERLKPFYCRIFPLCTVDGRVEFDDIWDGHQPCCTLADDGRTPAVEAYECELREILGPAAYRALRERTGSGTGHLGES